MMRQPPELIDYKEAIRILNISKSTFYKGIAGGEIPQGALIAGVRRWNKHAMYEYIYEKLDAANQADR